MFTFAWPWVFLLFPAPILVYLFLKPAQTVEPALNVPFYSQIEDLSSQHASSNRILKLALLTVIWMLTVIACARPQWIGEPDQIPITGRDLVLAVDVSGSMKAKDMNISGQNINRLVAVKIIGEEFIKARSGDRMGLILFGSKAYLQAPLSFDLKTINTLLQESQIGIAGEKTAIGDAIALSIKRLIGENTEAKLSDKVLILITDGANTSGAIEPLQAARMAANVNLKIYTIGIGADSMVVDSFFGQQIVNPSSELDVNSLTQIAQLTGGQYFRAKDIEGLAEIYERIDELEPINEDNRYLRPVEEWFHWFVLSAMGLIGMALVFSSFGAIPGTLLSRKSEEDEEVRSWT